MTSTSILRSVWVHVHVPKAGGSTLRQLMNRNFGKGYYNSSSLLETKQYNVSEVSEIIRCHPWVECFSDHKLSLDLPYQHPDAVVRAICYVRDPVERFISRYFFHRHFEEVNCIAQRLSFQDFLHAELVAKECHPQTNSQVYFLNGGTSFSDLKLIESALSTGQVFLFPIERFDESCICLERQFPQYFADLSYVPANVSKKDSQISLEDRRLVSELLQADRPLFQTADQFLDQTLQLLFPSVDDREASLAEFQDRCSRRFHNFFPPVGRGEPVPPQGSTPPPTRPDNISPEARSERSESETPIDPRYRHLAKPVQPTVPAKPTIPAKPTLPTRPQE